MNADPKTIQFVIGSGLIIFGIVILLVAIRVYRSARTTKRLEEFVLDQEKVRKHIIRTRLIPREISGSLISRTIRPALKKVVLFLGRFTPENTINQLEHQLGVANNPLNLTAASFYGIRTVMTVVGLVTGMLLNINNQVLDLKLVVLGLLVAIVIIELPTLWLRARMRKIQEEIRRGLPDVLDMLSVVTTAGLSFDQAMEKVADYWQTTLGLRFRRVLQEMQMGVSRADALRNMANRADVSELSSFVAVIIQAEVLGMQIAKVLHDQSDQMRDQRQLRAKEIANKLPVKMLPPLAFFILPALLAVILGPAILKILDLFKIY